MTVNIKKALFTGLTATLIICVFVGCTLIGTPGASPSASATTAPVVSATPTPTPSPTVSKADIQKTLESYGDKVFDVTWSPDNTMVAFIREEADKSNVYVWKISNTDAQLIQEAENTTDGFSWSPDSKHFLINVGHMGPGTITSTLVDAEALKVLDTSLATVNISPPVWSPDGRFIALSMDDLSTNNIKIIIYAVASKTSISALESTNTYGPYLVEKWEGDTITYTEMANTGERIEKTLGVAD